MTRAAPRHRSAASLGFSYHGVPDATKGLITCLLAEGTKSAVGIAPRCLVPRLEGGLHVRTRFILTSHLGHYIITTDNETLPPHKVWSCTPSRIA